MTHTRLYLGFYGVLEVAAAAGGGDDPNVEYGRGGRRRRDNYTFKGCKEESQDTDMD